MIRSFPARSARRSTGLGNTSWAIQARRASECIPTQQLDASSNTLAGASCLSRGLDASGVGQKLGDVAISTATNAERRGSRDPIVSQAVSHQDAPPLRRNRLPPASAGRRRSEPNLPATTESTRSCSRCSATERRCTNSFRTCNARWAIGCVTELDLACHPSRWRVAADSRKPTELQGSHWSRPTKSSMPQTATPCNNTGSAP